MLRGFCPVEVLPFLFSGKVLPTVLHVPSQVAPIMVFLAPQMKLILCTENFFDVDHFKKSLLNLLQYCLYLMFCGFFFLALSHVESYLPNQGLNPQAPALQGEVSHWPA